VRAGTGEIQGSDFRMHWSLPQPLSTSRVCSHHAIAQTLRESEGYEFVRSALVGWSQAGFAGMQPLVGEAVARTLRDGASDRVPVLLIRMSADSAPVQSQRNGIGRAAAHRADPLCGAGCEQVGDIVGSLGDGPPGLTPSLSESGADNEFRLSHVSRSCPTRRIGDGADVMGIQTHKLLSPS